MKPNLSFSLLLGTLVLAWPHAHALEAPALSITRQPVHLSVTPGARATFTVAASGTAPLRYQWRRDGTNLPGATEPSFTTPPQLAASTNRYAVVITNGSGAVTSLSVTSRLAYLSGTNTLVATGSVWRYLDTGMDLGTAWRAPAFNDAPWSSGPAELGYGQGDEATVVSFGTNGSNKYITTYFRRAFSVVSAPAVSNACLVVERDDAAAVYLNGVEVFRENLPGGPLSFTNRALASSGDLPRLTNYFDPGLLVSGQNVLAAEVHQITPTSADLSFELALYRNQTNGPGLTRGRLICVDNRPMTNVLVTVELRTNNILSSIRSDLTDTNGDFQVLFNCVSVPAGSEFRVYSTGCPSEEWSIPTTACYADLGQFVCRECAPSTRVPPRAMLWLPFDEPPGPVAVNLAGGNNGTLYNGTNIAILSGGPARSNGFVRTSLRFDGFNDSVRVPSYPEVRMGTNDFSIVAWVKTEVIETVPRVLVELLGPGGRGGEYGYSFRFAGGGFSNRLSLRLADGTGSNFISNLTVPTDGLWHQVAVTVDRNDPAGLRFYLDGIVDAIARNPTANMDSISPTIAVPLRLGSSSMAVSNVFRGGLDDVAVFRRALTAKEIRSIARAGASGMTQSKACAMRAILPVAASLAPLGVAPAPLGPPDPSGQVTTDVTVCNDTGTPQAFCITTDQGTSPVSTPCLQPNCCTTVTLDLPPATVGGKVTFKLYKAPGPCSGPSTTPPRSVTPCSFTVYPVTNQFAKISPNPAPALAPGPLAVATINFEVVNDTDQPFTADYQVRALSPNLDPSVNLPTLSGDIGGSIQVPPHGSTLRSVQAEYEPDPLVVYTVLLEVDSPGDSAGFEPWLTVDLITEIPPTCEIAITEQPADAFIPVNTSVTFHVAAVSSSDDLGYQWRKNGLPVSGATDTNFHIPSASLADEGAYDVIVTDDACGARLSRRARLLLREGLRLDITREATSVELRWAQKLAGFVLQGVNALPALETDWHLVSSPPSLENGFYRIGLTTEDEPMRFFRLARFGAVSSGCDCD